MSLLLLDIGNSRLKWALLHEPYRTRQRFAAGGALELESLRAAGAPLRRLFVSAGPSTSVHVCNVAGAAVERTVRFAARRAGLRAPHFARSVAFAAGVHNGYSQPWRLGVDRWAGLVGARHEYPGAAACIVGIGTAMTIDLLDARGRHRGGSITPGPRLMIESLLQNTAGIQRRAGGRGALRGLSIASPRSSAGSLWRRAPRRRGRGADLFARDTYGALLTGARHACAALVGEAMRSARGLLGGKPRLILAGGAADAIAPLLTVACVRADDLVLRGLAVLAGQSAFQRLHDIA